MSKHFVFTHNNYTAATLQSYRDLFENQLRDHGIHYAVYGQEVAPTTGTRHLQGYVAFTRGTRIRSVRALFPGAHVEVARGNPTQCRDYCVKDGDYVEHGRFDDIPFQGKRSDFDKYKEWLLSQSSWPSDAHIALNYPTMYIRYGKKLLEYRDLICPKPVLERGDCREGWQEALDQTLAVAPVDDRKITFYVDEDGNKGKTWFIRKYLSENDDAQMFGPGKRDDIAYAVDCTKRVYFFNMPRDSMQYMQYGVLESIKDRLVFSSKYQSVTKFLVHNPHVVVFCNEHPDETKLSADRFDIIYI
jgi:hypothetical protein